jgi:hypothetical protein
MRQEKVPNGLGSEQLENGLNMPFKTQRRINRIPFKLRSSKAPGTSERMASATRFIGA